MEEINQLLAPPSFGAVYSDARGRPSIERQALQARYELCEDLANHLVEQAQNLFHVEAPSESEILLRMHAGLSSPDSGIPAAEATWIICRLAELLAWQCPRLPSASEAGAIAADTDAPRGIPATDPAA